MTNGTKTIKNTSARTKRLSTRPALANKLLINNPKELFMRIFHTSIPAIILALSMVSPDLYAQQGVRSKSKSKSDAAAIYHNYCSVCHGDRGDGNSRATNSLNPPPKDFSMAGNLPRDYMITVVASGKPGTAMAGWETQLNRKEIESVVDYVRNRFMIVSIDPRLQRGKSIYLTTCVACHGPRGEGVFQPGMNVQPRNFADPAARNDLTRERMFDAVYNGKSGTSMISYRDRMPKKDIEAVVDYVRAALMMPEADISGTHAHGGNQTSASRDQADMTLPFPEGLKGDAKKGKIFFDKNCAECHGKKGDGKGPRAYFINPRPAIFSSEQKRKTLNRPAIYIFTSQGKLGTEMPAWNKVLTPQEIADVSEHVFTAFIMPGANKQSPKKTP